MVALAGQDVFRKCRLSMQEFKVNLVLEDWYLWWSKSSIIEKEHTEKC